MKSIINWEILQKLTSPPLPDLGGPGPNWDDIAPLYDRMAEMEREYTYRQIDCLDIAPTDTVLDVGCGPGRLTCALAERAKSVTALDAYPKMLDLCLVNAQARGLGNVLPLRLDWREAEPGANVAQHDIAVASRSIGMWDIEKLNNAAKKYAVIIGWANAPSIPPILAELFAGTAPGEEAGAMPGRREDRRVGYNVVWNMVYDLGADPNIRVVPDGFRRDFPDQETAYAWLRQIRPFAERYLPVFQQNLAPYLTPNDDGTVTFLRRTRSYVLWWEPVRLGG
ncbi:MAG: class I SAM-dependent methyltransferase [Gracilibacteraceae bacterium]|jgi:SAM-dependent methyltransferase|nr:class I SAM-dependent methyltransferase [Gracilibacteraceae bacterium]